MESKQITGSHGTKGQNKPSSASSDCVKAAAATIEKVLKQLKAQKVALDNEVSGSKGQRSKS